MYSIKITKSTKKYKKIKLDFRDKVLDKIL